MLRQNVPTNVMLLISSSMLGKMLPIFVLKLIHTTHTSNFRVQTGGTAAHFR